MNEQRAVIQQMVDALDHADELLGGNDTLVMNGAAAGRWLLEQPAVQEPVFCEYCGGNDDADFGLPTDHCTDCARPQPAAQPALVQEPAPQTWEWTTPATALSGGSGSGIVEVEWFKRPAPTVQEPVAWTDLLKQAEEVVRSKSLWKKYIDGTPLANDIAVWMVNFAQEHTTPPAPQPVPVKTYHDGKPWPVQPKPWVGLTDEERYKLYAAHHDSCGYPITATGYEKAIEAKLKEKNT
jgi:hypothetical protein